MPNWCRNSLIVSGNKAKAFVSAAKSKEEPLSFETILPTPSPYINSNDKAPGSFMPLWYEWRVSNWGTKWDVGEVIYTELPNGDHLYEFYSAWSPPEAFFLNISENYEDVIFTLEYREWGMDFAGRSTFCNGELLGEEEFSPREFKFLYNDEADQWDWDDAESE